MSVRRNRGNATHDLYWLADLPGLGGSAFFVRPTTSSSSDGRRATSVMSKEFIPQGDDFTIENKVHVMYNVILIRMFYLWIYDST